MEYIKVPENIEKRSFEIITEELGDKISHLPESLLPVIKRVIHTTADFEYADLLKFSEDAVSKGMEALEKGYDIDCDTQMI
ncbi:MAG: precorrin-8X methylmutase, partial [Fusobacteriaceae bacterium]